MYGLYVLAIDYRGYGDSSRISQVTETSLVHDATCAMEWLQKNIHPEARIIVWGHSLGTGVTCKLGSNVQLSLKRPNIFVLEAPFNSMKSITSYLRENGTGLFGQTMGIINKIFDYFADTMALLETIDLSLDSERWLKDIKQPVFILHAKDDAIVPFELGEKLYLEMVRNSMDIKLFSFEAEYELGHDDIYKYKMIDTVLNEIMKYK